MKTLHDLIKVDSEKTDKFFDKLREEGMELKLLDFCNGDYHYEIRGTKFRTNLPKDLSTDLDRIWVHLDD